MEVTEATEGTQQARERASLRIGAACAVLGSIFSVAAGSGFDNLTNEYGTEAVLNSLAFRPEWSWPLVYLGFTFGALLWIGALIVLADSFTGNLSRTLGRMGVASVVLGASIHVVDSSISGFGLAALARAWETASASEQANLLLAGDTLLCVLGGTWASVLSLFHGVPFILFGLAMVFSRVYLGWLDRGRWRRGVPRRRSLDVPRRGYLPREAVHRVRRDREPLDGGDGLPDVARNSVSHPLEKQRSESKGVAS